MVNVYNRTSGRIKNPTVHRTNVCESRSRPFTDAETRHRTKQRLWNVIIGSVQILFALR